MKENYCSRCSKNINKILDQVLIVPFSSGKLPGMSTSVKLHNENGVAWLFRSNLGIPNQLNILKVQCSYYQDCKERDTHFQDNFQQCFQKSSICVYIALYTDVYVALCTYFYCSTHYMPHCTLSAHLSPLEFQCIESRGPFIVVSS